MVANTKNINDIFQNSTVLRLPFFQRQYKWGKNEWERFFNDMESLQHLGNRFYFLGSLILKGEEVTTPDMELGIQRRVAVIDGQQRLTTISVFLKALDSLLLDENLHHYFLSHFFIQDGERKMPVLHQSINVRPAFEEVMWGNPLTAYEDFSVVKAYNYFRDRCRGLGQDELRRLWVSVFAHVKFVEILLDNTDDDQQIFDTINSLGVSLTIDELMKNFLYERNDEREYRQNWSPVFDTEESQKFWGANDAPRYQAEKDENKVISNFFYDFVRIKMWDYREQNDFNRTLFVQKSMVFTTCKSFVEQFGENKQTLANEILEYAKLYKRYFNKKNLNNRIPSEPCIERVACIAMAKDSTITPYLLYVLKNVEDINERNSIFAFLETYLVRRMVCLPSTASKMGNEFYTEQLIGNRIDTCEKLRDYIKNIDSERNMHMPTDDEIRRNLPLTEFSDDSTPRLIFYLHETRQGKRITGGYNHFVAEQIIPKVCSQNRINYPPFEDENLEQERKMKVKTIGNFVLLTLPHNENDPDQENEDQRRIKRELKRVSNAPFNIKHPVMKNLLNGQICGDWFNRLRQWTLGDIDTRNRRIFETLIPTVWPIGA